MNILTHPNPKLREKAKKIDKIDLKIRQLAKDLEKLMKENGGIGLAATQCGISKQLFVVATSKGAATFINPKITKKSLKKTTEQEGCLSIPGIIGMVKRSQKIVVETTDLDGKRYTVKAQGLFARVIQHEYDHLQGVLFIDKASKITKE